MKRTSRLDFLKYTVSNYEVLNYIKKISQSSHCARDLDGETLAVLHLAEIRILFYLH